jgi:hypothetical protein
VVVVFAIAMAWLESATVTYLRTLTGRLQPYQPNPVVLSSGSHLAAIEAIREFATLVMLLAVGGLAGGTWRRRLAYTMIAFGVWDILYYVFLAITGPWPRSILDWDVLFLLPLPWWGPVLAPAAISILLIVAGTLITQFGDPERELWPKAWSGVACLSGIGLALYVFMQDTLKSLLLAPTGQTLGQVLPTHFNWLLFIAATVLMTMPVFDLCRQLWGRAGKSG